MEITGVIKHKQALVTGEGANGTWKKQEFVLETQGDYPKKVAFELWGDKIIPLQKDELVTAHINLESREYNGRWYTNVKAWKIDKGEQAAEASEAHPAAHIPAAAAANDDLLF